MKNKLKYKQPKNKTKNKPSEVKLPRVFYHYWKFAKKYKWQYLIVLVFHTIGSVLLFVINPLFYKKIINLMNSGTDFDVIWNILLTISFLAMAILSVLLIIQINSGNTIHLGINILYWHVITGIIMTVITLFHMGWHWRYYKNLFK